MLELAIVVRRKPLFSLGRVCITATADHALASYPGRALELVARHASGDWGHVCKDDSRRNDHAVRDGVMILSAYPIDPAKPSKGHGENTVWVITEWDRSVTTVLLPEDY